MWSRRCLGAQPSWDLRTRRRTLNSYCIVNTTSCGSYGYIKTEEVHWQMMAHSNSGKMLHFVVQSNMSLWKEKQRRTAMYQTWHIVHRRCLEDVAHSCSRRQTGSHDQLHETQEKHPHRRVWIHRRYRLLHTPTSNLEIYLHNSKTRPTLSQAEHLHSALTFRIFPFGQKSLVTSHWPQATKVTVSNWPNFNHSTSPKFTPSLFTIYAQIILFSHKSHHFRKCFYQ